MFFSNPAGNATVSLSALGLDVGQSYTLIVTNTDQDCTLEFLHGDDPTWYPYPPSTDGAAIGGVIVMPFKCLGGAMRVKFAAGPTEATLISAPVDAESSF